MASGMRIRVAPSSAGGNALLLAVLVFASGVKTKEHTAGQLPGGGKIVGGESGAVKRKKEPRHPNIGDEALSLSFQLL
jgi:hypothetical protein